MTNIVYASHDHGNCKEAETLDGLKKEKKLRVLDAEK